MFRTEARTPRMAGMALALALLAAPAAAQQVSDSHLAAARAAIAAAHAGDQFDQILPALSEQTKALFQRSNPAAVADIDQVVADVALKLVARRPELQREIERVWATHFSEDELKAITAFYTSPVGMKFGTTMPVVIQESMRAGRIWKDTVATEIVTKSREELNKRGHQF